MTITEIFSSRRTYGVTHATLDARGLHFESEGAVHLEDGSVVMQPLPTRQDEKQAIRTALRPKQSQVA